MKSNLREVDKVLGDNLAKFDVIAQGLLDRQGRIIDDSLTRVDLMLSENVTRVEQLTDRSITRLESLQEDTFDRVNATLQDQVPFAASNAVREVVWPVLIVFSTCALIGFVVLQSRRGQPVFGFHADWTATKGAWAQHKGLGILRGIIAPFRPHGLIRQGAYACVAVVGLSFVGHNLCQRGFATAENNRIANLEKAAQSFEVSGDYRSAWSIYRRVATLSTSSEPKYKVDRARFLADFAQPTLQSDPAELNRRLQSLRSLGSGEFDSDGELKAAELYVAASLGLVDIAGTPLNLDSELNTYQTKFITGKASKPRQGKLVMVTRLRMALGKGGASSSERLDEAIKIAKEITIEYPSYFQAKASLINLLAIQQGSERLMPDASGAAVDKGVHDDEIERLATEVAKADPVMYAMLRFKTAELDEGDATAMADGSFAAAFKPLDEKATDDQKRTQREQQKAHENTAARLSTFAEGLMSEAIGIYSHPALARAETERVVARALIRDVGMVDLKKSIDTARKKMTEPKATKQEDADAAAKANFDLAIKIAKQALALNQPVIAERWIRRAEMVKPRSNWDKPKEEEIDAMLTEASAPLSKAYPTLF
jgi:hypothetical protein